MVAPARMSELVEHADETCRLPDGVAVTFDIEGEGVWTLLQQGGRLSVQRGDRERPDCRFACSADDFTSWVNGELDPVQAHVERRVRLEGDVGLIFRIRQGLDRGRRRTPCGHAGAIDIATVERDGV